jgi:hypothetical protein
MQSNQYPLLPYYLSLLTYLYYLKKGNLFRRQPLSLVRRRFIALRPPSLVSTILKKGEHVPSSTTLRGTSSFRRTSSSIASTQMDPSPTNHARDYNAFMSDAMTPPPYPTWLRRNATQYPPPILKKKKSTRRPASHRRDPVQLEDAASSERDATSVAPAVRGQVRHHRPPQHLSRTA